MFYATEITIVGVSCNFLCPRLLFKSHELGLKTEVARLFCSRAHRRAGLSSISLPSSSSSPSRQAHAPFNLLPPGSDPSSPSVGTLRPRRSPPAARRSGPAAARRRGPRWWCCWVARRAAEAPAEVRGPVPRPRGRVGAVRGPCPRARGARPRPPRRAQGRRDRRLVPRRPPPNAPLPYLQQHRLASISRAMDGISRKHRILMVSDFFFPNFGGVESHIYYLSQCLLKLGHKVVVMTHAYGNRSGVRYVTGGLKVYYVPWRPFLMQNTLPTLFMMFPIIRTILIRERISVVHGHQAFSTLCHEALMHARTMGYKGVFTDHSLYGFADVGSIHMNKVLQFTLADIDQAICVSHTSKENTVLRSGISPEKVFMVPNAVDTAMFTPSPKRLSRDEIIIVVISRLVYRKGADLLVEVIPEVCRLFPKVRFIVGGDGPKRVRLEEMREKFSLQDRVEMLGAVPHAQVRSVLISGHIFLNSSLTEAFCIAILEAASCGLLTVSTRVGGVPEVLPDDMIVLAEPDPEDMVRAVRKAIDILPGIEPQTMHLRMKGLYSWDDVAKRTEIVYDRAMQSSDTNLLDRLPKYLTCGAWAGKLFCLVMIINYLVWCLLEFLQPTKDIEEVPDIIGPLHSQLRSVDDDLHES